MMSQVSWPFRSCEDMEWGVVRLWAVWGAVMEVGLMP